MASTMKLIVMISTIGRSPSIAAPVAMPINPFSTMGVSTTRLGPNSESSPAVILYDPSKTPIASPRRNTFSSRSSSSRSASWSACREVISAIPSPFLRCFAWRVDVAIQIAHKFLHRGKRAFLGKLDRCIDIALHLFLERVPTTLIEEPGRFEACCECLYWVMRTPFLHLLSVSIAIRVHHGVTAEAEAHRFDEARFMLFTSKRCCLAHGIPYGQDIIAVHSPTLHVVGTRLAV